MRLKEPDNAIIRRLEELDAGITRYKAKVEELKSDAAAGAKEKLDKLKEMRKTAGEELDRYREAGGIAMERVGQGLQKSLDELSEALDDAMKILTLGR